MAKIEEGERPVFSERYANQGTIAKKGYELFKRIKEELK